MVVVLYFKEDTPSKLLSIERGLTEPFFVEIDLCNKKNRLISCCYNQNWASTTNYFSAVTKNIDVYIYIYSKYIDYKFSSNQNQLIDKSNLQYFKWLYIGNF